MIILMIGSAKRGKLHNQCLQCLKLQSVLMPRSSFLLLLLLIYDVTSLVAGIVLDTGIAVYTTRNAYPVGTSVEYNYSMMISNHIYACEVCIDIIVFKSHVLIKVLLRQKSYLILF